MYLLQTLEYASGVLIVITLYLVRQWKELSDIIRNKYESEGRLHKSKTQSKKRSRTKSSKTPKSVKRLSGSYFLVTDSATSKKRSSPSATTDKKKPSGLKPKRLSGSYFLVMDSATTDKKTPSGLKPKSKQSGDSSSRRNYCSSIKAMLHRSSPNYINSRKYQIRKVNVRGTRPLPARITMLRRCLYWFFSKFNNCSHFTT